MNASLTFVGPTRYPPRTRFVLVNDRIPRTDASCAQCRAKIEVGYVREPRTSLLYCNIQCFTRQKKSVMIAIMNRVRRVSRVHQTSDSSRGQADALINDPTLGTAGEALLYFAAR
jgi:hypothetical protein